MHFYVCNLREPGVEPLVFYVSANDGAKAQAKAEAIARPRRGAVHVFHAQASCKILLMCGRIPKHQFDPGGRGHWTKPRCATCLEFEEHSSHENAL